jgi:hypothetical protein
MEIMAVTDIFSKVGPFLSLPRSSLKRFGLGENSMANAVFLQLAVLSGLVAILICLLVVYKRRKTQIEPPHAVPIARAQITPSQAPPNPVPVERTITVETVVEKVEDAEPVKMSSAAATAKPTVVLHAQPVARQEDRNQQILAGISANIRKSMIKPLPTYSPIDYPEPPRDTEYVRVKKKIITPHGQIRFSILKDSLSVNMLAVFRRASLNWQTPDDLIGFVPAYLEPEAEILNGQVLLVSTPGHPEKLAIPIRSVDAESTFHSYFDFVTDDRAATNTPAVLLFSDTEFELISKGVITQPVFMNRSERFHSQGNLLDGKSGVRQLIQKSSAAGQ